MIFFTFLSNGIKKRKPIVEGNFRSNINIEGHIADLHCLFWYFKNIWPFLFIIISLNKDIFLPSCCWMEKKLAFSKKKHLFHWWHSPSCLVKFIWYHYELYFPAIAMWYSSSTIMTMKAPPPWEYKVFVWQFLKFTFIYKRNKFLKNIIKNPYKPILIPKLKQLKLK